MSSWLGLLSQSGLAIVFLALALALIRLGRRGRPLPGAALGPLAALALAGGIGHAAAAGPSWAGTPLAVTLARIAAVVLALFALARLAPRLARRGSGSSPRCREAPEPERRAARDDPHALRGHLHTIALQAELLRHFESDALGEDGRLALRRLDGAVRELASRLEPRAR